MHVLCTVSVPMMMCGAGCIECTMYTTAPYARNQLPRRDPLITGPLIAAVGHFFDYCLSNATCFLSLVKTNARPTGNQVLRVILRVFYELPIIKFHSHASIVRQVNPTCNKFKSG